MNMMQFWHQSKQLLRNIFSLYLLYTKLPILNSTTYTCRLGMLGSIDSNTGSPDLGWDTDQFPMDIKNTALVMKVVRDYIRNHPSNDSSNHPPIHTYIYLSICPSIYLSIHPSIYPSIHPSTCLSIICPSTHSTVYYFQYSILNRQLLNKGVWLQGVSILTARFVVSLLIQKICLQHTLVSLLLAKLYSQLSVLSL